ncbi:RNA polymerase sigma factor [Urechidicola croceus]|uniref:RNA polymerase sigma factor n=1 Tax=Urechidicola croceus TaxID=1850246 RepID=A0A1D8P406_9FLAO|nr:RNA polymerase sigma factor [Urechidicola croceus]AOW19298.1 RNA polymerase subunit sigma-70 [Urechidicola croceus]
MIDEQKFVQLLIDKKTQDQAFRKLISLYKERLYWHIRKIVLSHEDTDDVLQNTFVKVYKNIDTFNNDSKIYTWIYRIATNEALTYINKRAKQRNLNIEDFQKQLIENLTEDPLFNGDEIQLILQKAIATLPQKQQLVFKMKYFDEMKYSEISEILETSVGALKSSYFHAVKKIEKIITPQ